MSEQLPRHTVHSTPTAIHRRRLVVLAAVVTLAALAAPVQAWPAVRVVSALGITVAPAVEPAPTAAATVPAAGHDGSSGRDDVYVVQPGDTLWAIAAKVHPDGDIREVVDALAERSGGSRLQAGQRLDLRGLRG